MWQGWLYLELPPIQKCQKHFAPIAVHFACLSDLGTGLNTVVFVSGGFLRYYCFRAWSISCLETDRYAWREWRNAFRCRACVRAFPDLIVLTLVLVIVLRSHQCTHLLRFWQPVQETLHVFFFNFFYFMRCLHLKGRSLRLLACLSLFPLLECHSSISDVPSNVTRRVQLIEYAFRLTFYRGRLFRLGVEPMLYIVTLAGLQCWAGLQCCCCQLYLSNKSLVRGEQRRMQISCRYYVFNLFYLINFEQCANVSHFQPTRYATKDKAIIL